MALHPDVQTHGKLLLKDALDMQTEFSKAVLEKSKAEAEWVAKFGGRAEDIEGMKPPNGARLQWLQVGHLGWKVNFLRQQVGEANAALSTWRHIQKPPEEEMSALHLPTS